MNYFVHIVYWLFFLDFVIFYSLTVYMHKMPFAKVYSMPTGVPDLGRGDFSQCKQLNCDTVPLRYSGAVEHRMTVRWPCGGEAQRWGDPGVRRRKCCSSALLHSTPPRQLCSGPGRQFLVFRLQPRKRSLHWKLKVYSLN